MPCVYEVHASSPFGPIAMSSASPSGAGMKTFAVPVLGSTSHISLPTTVPAKSRPCASTATPCTPWNAEGATSTSGADHVCAGALGCAVSAAAEAAGAAVVSVAAGGSVVEHALALIRALVNVTPNNLSPVPIEVPPEGPPVYTLCHLPARESNALS